MGTKEKNDVVRVNLTELQGSNAAGLSSPPQASQTPQGSAGPQVGFNSPAGFEMLQRAAKMLKAGIFLPNPRSQLCSAKYCPMYLSCRYRG